METVATLALKEGMTIGTDVVSHDKVIVPANTKVDSVILQKLHAFHVMTVSVLEPEDFASTYYEKLRVSKAFKNFEQTYKSKLASYKVAIDSFIYAKLPFSQEELISIANTLVPEEMSGRVLFAYLYLLPPSEDNLTYAHGLNVALISTIFARWLRFNEEDTKNLILSGFLYDIGKFMIPSDIIWKSSKLNKMEFDLVKTHAFYGYHLLSKLNLNEHILSATLQHHERCDGSGYPQGLKGDETDPFAKIIAIADMYEAMTSSRTYREPMCPYTVIGIFESECFQKYDVPFVTTFIKHVADELIGNRVRLSNGLEGEVVMNNHHNYSRPLVKCEDAIIDLSKQRDVKIIAVI